MIEPFYSLDYLVPVAHATKLLVGRQITCNRVQFGIPHRVDQFILHGTIGTGDVQGVRALFTFSKKDNAHICRVILHRKGQEGRWMEGRGQSVAVSGAITNAINALAASH